MPIFRGERVTSLIRVIIIAAIIGGFAVSSAGAREFSVVAINAGDPAAVQRIADQGIDIWAVSGGTVTAAVTAEQLAWIQGQDFIWTMLFTSRAELDRTIRAAALPAAISYRNHDQVVAEMQHIAAQYPAIARLYNLGTTYENRPVWALKITEKAYLDRSVPRILYCGEHHAREWISVEVPLRLADYIASNYATSPALQRRLNQGEIWIVPMVNPDGYLYSWTNDRWWRKNRRPVGSYYGVDLNRNYGYHWGEGGSSSDPSSEIYRGPSAFSEKETQAIRDLMLSRQFYSLITYHNYSQLILWPWGYTTSPAPDAATFSSLGGQMASLIAAVHGFNYTPEQSSTLYITSGDTCDWAYGVEAATGVETVTPFTIELRPVGYPYFELPPDQIIPTFEENLPAAMYLLDWTETGNPTVGIEVFTNLPVASFNITGPTNYSGSGTHWLQTGVPNGSYAIAYNSVPGWVPPPPDGGSVNSTLLSFEANYTPDYRRISELKGRADGEPAALQAKTVTAVFAGYFYVEETDNSSGIRVNWPTPPAEGSSVNVIGTMTTESGERAINAQTVE